MDYLGVNLGILSIHLLFRDEVQIVWEGLLVPVVFLDLLKCNSFYWIGLKHPVYQVLNTWRQIIWNEVTTFFDLVEKLWHLVVIEG